jgi:LysR family cyn operon transcriptional activator
MLLRHIRYFLAVAEHANFTRAAEALHVSQPTLSQQVRQLEDMLGVQLLDRTGKTIRLTDAGAAYRHYAQRALQDLEAGRRAIHDVQELTRGSLRVAMTPTFTAYLIGPLIDEFNRRYPKLSLTIEEMPQERIEGLLSEDALDVGIAFEDVNSPDIEAQAFLVETLALVVGKSHVHARHSGTLSLEAFAQTELALLNETFATRSYIDQYCRQHAVAPHIVIEANSISAVVEIVRSGNLATILPISIAQERTDLISIGLEPALPRRTAALLQRRGAYRSAAARAFIMLAAESKWKNDRLLAEWQ